MFAESRSEGRLYMLFCAILQKGLETLGVSVFAGSWNQLPIPMDLRGGLMFSCSRKLSFFGHMGGLAP